MQKVLVPILLFGSLLLACGPTSTDDELVFAATEIGTPEGDRITKNIGPAGGTIDSADGRLTLNVPKDALTETIAFSIQPITNKTQGGHGLAHRLEPDGMIFSSPLEISVRYDDHDLEGTVPEALSLAYQDNNGVWTAQPAKLDTAKKTLTVSTTHFTDYAILSRLRMSPPEVTLWVRESRFIQLLNCKQSYLQRFLSRPLDCSASPTGNLQWSLRGPGELKNSLSGKQPGVMYTAPAKKPATNVAFVDLEAEFYFRRPDTGETTYAKRTFSTKITILERGYRAAGHDGSVSYSGVICDLEKPFTVTGTQAGHVYTYNFSPAGSSTGNGKFSAEGFVLGGSGPYKVEGAETDKPRIVWTPKTTAGIGLPVSVTRVVTYNIELVPLEADECTRAQHQ